MHGQRRDNEGVGGREGGLTDEQAHRERMGGGWAIIAGKKRVEGRKNGQRKRQTKGIKGGGGGAETGGKNKSKVRNKWNLKRVESNAVHPHTQKYFVNYFSKNKICELGKAAIRL